jgi:hypothetical protein
LNTDLNWPFVNRTELQFSIPIYSLTGKPGCKQYLEEFDLKNSSKIFTFIFPNIHKTCPACSRTNDAIWKGFYSRGFYCPTLDFHGRIKIRKGFCKSGKVHFSMLPDFCIPCLRWSKFLFVELLKKRSASFFHSYDWELSFSTLYWIGAFLVKLLRINAHLYFICAPRTNSVCELQNYTSGELQKLPLLDAFSWNNQIKPSATSPPR